MRWKPSRKRKRQITRSFAILPTYIGSTGEYIWLEWCYCYAVHTIHGTAAWYDTDYRYLYNGFVKAYKL